MAKKYSKICANPDCGKPFETEKPKQIYCSPDCRQIMRKIKSRECNKKNYEEKRAKQRAKDVKSKYNTIDKTLERCREEGISYAENQQRQSLKLYARVIL